MEWILDNIGTLVVGLILLTVIYFVQPSPPCVQPSGAKIQAMALPTAASTE